MEEYESKVKLEDQDVDIVDLVDSKSNTPIDIVLIWHLEMTKKFGRSIGTLGENNLVALMREYIISLRERAINFEEIFTLLPLVEKHMEHMYWLYTDFDICFPESYLDSMEHITTFYLNLTLRIILSMKNRQKVTQQKIKELTENLIKRLSFYLLNSEYHVWHVLIRQNTILTDEMVKDVTSIVNSHMCKQVFRYLYVHFLLNTPIRDTSDEAFCRGFILFENWKAFEGHKQDKKIDECLVRLFKKTPDSIVQKCQFFRKILKSKEETLIKAVGCDQGIIKAYFDYVRSKQRSETEILNDISKITLDNTDWDEDDEINDRYKELFEKVMGEQHSQQLPATKTVQENNELCTVIEKTIEIIDVSDDDSDVEIIYPQENKETDNKTNSIELTHPQLPQKETTISANSDDDNIQKDIDESPRPPEEPVDNGTQQITTKDPVSNRYVENEESIVIEQISHSIVIDEDLELSECSEPSTSNTENPVTNGHNEDSMSNGEFCENFEIHNAVVEDLPENVTKTFSNLAVEIEKTDVEITKPEILEHTTPSNNNLPKNTADTEQNEQFATNLNNKEPDVRLQVSENMQPDFVVGDLEISCWTVNSEDVDIPPTNGQHNSIKILENHILNNGSNGTFSPTTEEDNSPESCSSENEHEAVQTSAKVLHRTFPQPGKLNGGLVNGFRKNEEVNKTRSNGQKTSNSTAFLDTGQASGADSEKDEGHLDTGQELPTSWDWYLTPASEEDEQNVPRTSDEHPDDEIVSSNPDTPKYFGDIVKEALSPSSDYLTDMENFLKSPEENLEKFKRKSKKINGTTREEQILDVRKEKQKPTFVYLNDVKILKDSLSRVTRWKLEKPPCVKVQLMPQSTVDTWKRITERSREESEGSSSSMLKVVFDKNSTKDQRFFIDSIDKGNGDDEFPYIPQPNPVSYIPKTDSVELLKNTVTLKFSEPLNAWTVVENECNNSKPEIHSPSSGFSELANDDTFQTNPELLSPASSEFSDTGNMIPYQDIERALAVVDDHKTSDFSNENLSFNLKTDEELLKKICRDLEQEKCSNVNEKTGYLTENNSNSWINDKTINNTRLKIESPVISADTCNSQNYNNESVVTVSSQLTRKNENKPWIFQNNNNNINNSGSILHSNNKTTRQSLKVTLPIPSESLYRELSQRKTKQLEKNVPVNFPPIIEQPVKKTRKRRGRPKKIKEQETISTSKTRENSKQKPVTVNLPEILPTPIPETFDFEADTPKNEVYNSLNDFETHLPLKKRKLSIPPQAVQIAQEKHEISYPATPMLSIADVFIAQTSQQRPFKTPAEKKQLPSENTVASSAGCSYGYVYGYHHGCPYDNLKLYVPTPPPPTTILYPRPETFRN